MRNRNKLRSLQDRMYIKNELAKEDRETQKRIREIVTDVKGKGRK